jgi:hypothetical protein
MKKGDEQIIYIVKAKKSATGSIPIFKKPAAMAARYSER